jgi:MFS family permease
MVAAIAAPGERERWFGFLGALRNSGFAVGGLAAAAAMTVGTDVAYTAVVLVNAASYAASFLLMAGVAAHEGNRPARGAQTGGWGVVLRDRGYRWLLGANFAYAMAGMALNIAIPVYVVQRLGLPGWVSGAVFVINTVLIGVGQGLVVNAMTGVLRTRILYVGMAATGTSFVLLELAHGPRRVTAIVVILVAAVVYTVGEMVCGPVLAALAAESAPVRLRGRYMAAYQSSWNGSSALAPVLFAWLLARGSLALWGGLVVVTVLGAGCVPRMRRTLPLAGRPVTNRAVEEGEHTAA